MTTIRPAACIALILLVVAVPSVHAQRRSRPAPPPPPKKAMDHADVDRWRYVSGQRLSDDGAWAVWREWPDTIGDGEVVVRSTDGRTTHRIVRGDNGQVTADSRFAVAIVKPPYDSTRAAKMAGKKGDKLPKDSLVVIDLATGTRFGYGRVKSYAVPERAGGVLAVLFEAEPDTAKTKAKPDSTANGAKKDSTAVKHDKTDGTRLVLRHLATGAEAAFPWVREYRLSRDGAWLVYTAENKAGTADAAIAVHTDTGVVDTLLSGAGYYRQLALSDASDQVAFLSNTADFAAKQPVFTLYRATLGEPVAALASEGQPGLAQGWWVSENASLDFSRDGSRLFFGTAPRPEPEPEEDKRPDEEKIKLDVWAWTDPLLQPMQLVQKDRDLKRTYRAVVFRSDNRIVQLATLDMPEVSVPGNGNAATAIGTSNLPYRQEISWESPGFTDIYAVDVATGARRLLLEANRSFPQASPTGAHIAWFDGAERVWKVTDTATGATNAWPTGTAVHNELDDEPMLPGSYGSAGWSDDGGAFVFYDSHDLWIASPRGPMIANMTDGKGREQGVRYRFVQLDADATGIDLTKPLFLTSFDLETKASGFALLSQGSEGPAPLVTGAADFGTPRKARSADRLLYTRETFVEFPDLWTAGLDLKTPLRLSDANPQQAEYRWGTAELVHWTSVDGIPLDGILFKPDGYDASKPHPTIVNFYERDSDGLHSWRSPRFGGSSVAIPFYVSRGYVVFMPDVPYKAGYPGESAMNAVMPGVTMLIDRGIADRERIGAQGHSWGGYQLTYMITQTNLFAAVEAGAPVVNMTSAYGGIRWGSGMSRAFQYERTQSRIGGSLWERPLHFIHNSPLFQLDKVETPLLYMHNDQDGAVPWEQGIELFSALRRLQKPVWMLNYNGADHGLSNYFQRKDFAQRMQQFFDHYLLGTPMPVWMAEGIPAVKKGRTLGLETVGGDR